MTSEAQKRASAKYRAKILAGLNSDMGSRDHVRAVEFANRLRGYAAKSARNRYENDLDYAEQKRVTCRLAAYYNNDDGKFLLAVRRLFV
jgi:hypothetical protein